MPFILDREIDLLYKEGVEKGKVEAEKEIWLRSFWLVQKSKII